MQEETEEMQIESATRGSTEETGEDLERVEDAGGKVEEEVEQEIVGNHSL